MMVLILENVSPGMRGELSKWMIEPHPGVFVGHVTATVRDKLWEKACKNLGDGGAVQLWSADTEQRFRIRTWGKTRREIVDFEGLQLVRLPSVTKD